LAVVAKSVLPHFAPRERGHEKGSLPPGSPRRTAATVFPHRRSPDARHEPGATSKSSLLSPALPAPFRLPLLAASGLVGRPGRPGTLPPIPPRLRVRPGFASWCNLGGVCRPVNTVNTAIPDIRSRREATFSSRHRQARARFAYGAPLDAPSHGVGTMSIPLTQAFAAPLRAPKTAR
jgi:hypothetical protein